MITTPLDADQASLYHALSDHAVDLGEQVRRLESQQASDVALLRRCAALLERAEPRSVVGAAWWDEPMYMRRPVLLGTDEREVIELRHALEQRLR